MNINSRFNPTLWSRSRKRLVMIAADAIILLFVAWLAYVLRFNALLIPTQAQATLMLVAPLVTIPVFYRFGIYRSVVRFIDDRALQASAFALGISSALWAVAAFLTETTGGEGLPRSVPIIYWITGTLLIAASRMCARAVSRRLSTPRRSFRNIVIVGAGAAGRELAASLREGSDLRPIAFVDHDERLHGSLIGGLPVHPPSALSYIIEGYDVKEVIIAWPSVPPTERPRIFDRLRQEPVRVRSLPALSAIASGRHLVNLVREVDMTDVLGRDPVAPIPELMGRGTAGKSVLVTGAGGSIGSEICRQVALQSPKRLVLLELNEQALYNIERELSAVVELVCYLGSVGDGPLIARILDNEQIETIYHAAAHNHVPIVERNVLEGIRNNVFGTLTLAQAAYESCVDSFVLISSDKAVRPANVMGATKRWAELIVQDFSMRAKNSDRPIRFCAVRFGNVLGSSGSVVPLFKEQISRGGPITVTHAEMTRYFMSIHEAVGLVIQAGGLAQGGEIFLLDMGQPVKIMDLARNMIVLSGQTVRDEENPDGDVEIRVVGLRPGEKLYEELLISEGGGPTIHEKIIVGDEPALKTYIMQGLIARLRAIVANNDSATARELVLDIARGHSIPAPQLESLPTARHAE
jgi:FlaA1/EpsC-like NDP-sugar epimerase